MAQLLTTGTCVHIATGTCAPAALDEQLQDLLANFHEAHPEAIIGKAEHQLVLLSMDGKSPQLLVSLLVNFSYSKGWNNELHSRVRHLTIPKMPGAEETLVAD